MGWGGPAPCLLEVALTVGGWGGPAPDCQLNLLGRPWGAGWVITICDA